MATVIKNELTRSELDKLRRATLRELRDAATATAVLNRVRDELAAAEAEAEAAGEHLRAKLIEFRPLGFLTVNQMAEIIGKDRNYIDTLWSLHGDGRRERPTRVHRPDADQAQVRATRDELNRAADRVARADARLAVARQNRNDAIAGAYVAFSDELGPSAISRAVGVDRNHVLRLARRKGIPPMFSRKNQYSKK